jgi:hypothetical protein
MIRNIVQSGLQRGADGWKQFGDGSQVITQQFCQLQRLGQGLGAQAEIPRLPALQGLRLMPLVRALVTQLTACSARESLLGASGAVTGAAAEVPFAALKQGFFSASRSSFRPVYWVRNASASVQKRIRSPTV